jgi:hypothetical protein
MALTATFDKPNYAKGDTITLTVTRDAVPLGVTVTDSANETTTPSASIDNPVTVTDTDTARTWTVVSDDQHTAVYTAVA